MRRRRSRFIFFGLPFCLFLLGILATSFGGGSWLSSSSASQEHNPFLKTPMFAAPHSPAAEAATTATGKDRAVLERLAAVPTGIWLLPEKFPAGQVGPYVRKLMSAAQEKSQLPVFVIYGIPDRDCSGGYSKGGLSAREYLSWVREIAAAADDTAAAVLEPDALATAAECGQVDERVALLKDAVQILRSAGPTTYVDAGHADWIEPQQMAALLKAVGVNKVRGFATNVAGYDTSADERTYAEAVSDALGGAHYVIDSGRNGAGATGEWCNPPGSALGAEPGFVNDGSAQDAYVWVKPPGESDGECQGGPAAGTWWTTNALELAANANW